MATYTGWSRVEGQKHFADDVISGGAIALFSDFLLVEPADPEQAARWRDLERRRPYRLEWEVADGDVSRNQVQAPSGAGTPLDFRFDGDANPQVTASLAGDVLFGSRHHLKFRYTPFEVRELAVLDEETSFGNAVFPEGTDVFSVYFLGDFRSRYAFELVPASRFSAQIGAGATILDTLIELAPVTYRGDQVDIHHDERESVRALDTLPLLYLRLGVELGGGFEIYAEADGWSSSTETFYDASAKLLYRVNANWEVAGGYRWVDDELEIEDVSNDFRRKGAVLHFAYSF
jgi:hypothetical protein